jgi:ParB family chromosome partitioning protein
MTTPAPQPPKRGLGALLAATTSPVTSQQAQPVPAVTSSDVDVKAIRPNPSQPRTQFDDIALHELAASIKERGLIQPVVVRPLNPPEGSARFEIIAGERRWRASQLAGLTQIPIVVKAVYDQRDILLLSLVENLQRDDLNAVEESLAYDRLSKTFNLTHEQIANGVGKSRVYVTNAIRILELPETILDALRNKKISTGHAKVLLSLPDLKLQNHFAAKTQAEGLTVRQLEKLTVGTMEAEDEQVDDDAPEASGKATGKNKRKAKRRRRITSAELQDLERRMREHFGTRVTIEEGLKKGRVILEFYSIEDLNRIIGLFDME